MAKESCIPHSGDMVVIRQEYVKMFGGSHAHAAVLDCLEFLTNGKIAILEAGDSVEDPWFEASCAALTNACVGLYGRTTILGCLDDLEERKIIRSRQGQRGTPKQYLLDYKSVTKLLQNGSSLPPDTPSKIELPPVQNWTGTSPKLDAPPSKIEPVLYNAVRTHQNASEPSLPSQEELPFETFAKIALSKYKQTRGTHVDSKRQDKRRFLDWLGEVSRTQAEVFSALDRFLQDDYWRKEKFPLPAFTKQFEKYADGDRETYVPVASVPVPSVPITPSRDFVGEWNILVPSSPVNSMSGSVSVPAECAANAVFCDRFAEVCRAAQKIHELKGEEASWLTFRWIVRKKTGEEYGWWRLLTDMRGMSVEPKSNLQKMLDRA